MQITEPKISKFEDQDTFWELVHLTYGELNEMNTSKDCDKLRRTILDRYATDNLYRPIWYGQLERLEYIIERRIKGLSVFPLIYWEKLIDSQ